METTIISKRRQENLKKAFSWVDWNFEESKLINFGVLGDRPQFEFKGEYKGCPIIYRNQSPSGSPATFRIDVRPKGRIHRIGNAPLIEANKIKKIVDEII